MLDVLLFALLHVFHIKWQPLAALIEDRPALNRVLAARPAPLHLLDLAEHVPPLDVLLRVLLHVLPVSLAGAAREHEAAKDRVAQGSI